MPKKRGRPKVKPAKAVQIRLEVSTETAAEFRKLAAQLSEPRGSAGLASRLAEAAVAAGPDGTVSLKAIREQIDDEYRKRVEGAGE